MDQSLSVGHPPPAGTSIPTWWQPGLAILGMCLLAAGAALACRCYGTAALAIGSGAMVLGVLAFALHATGQTRAANPARPRVLAGGLTRLVAAVCGGKEPIETLERVEGAQQELARLVAGILHDLKLQRREVARLEHEMSQRVAQRTEALEHKYNCLQTQATRDSLTGLFNRHWYDRHLPGVVEQTAAAGGELCLLMLDLDNFKYLNDTLGHAAGDGFLRDVGNIIHSTIRPDDPAFRCGGDEFVVALPGVGLGEGQAVARRLGELIDALGRRQRLKYPAGCSIGVACLSELDDGTLPALTALADGRLYETKARRRAASAPRNVELTALRKSA
jgi:diguanylate cyclase (GGDEF)-like protein